MSSQDDLFDILDGTDEFPDLNKVTKESFLADIDKLIKNDIVEDPFDVDEFLYKNFRFISLQDLYSELSNLHKDLDTELLNLVNDDYADFVSLGKLINNDNFLNLMSSIKLSVVNYKENVLKQQQELNLDLEIISSQLLAKKRLSKLKAFLKKTQQLESLIDVFESILLELQEEKTDIMTPEQAVLQEFGGKEDINVEIIKELTSVYLLIHQLQMELQNQAQKSESPQNTKTKIIDVLDTIQALDKLEIADLLESEPKQDQEDPYHEKNVSPITSIQNNPFVEAQFKRVNKLQFEYRAILDEFLRKTIKASPAFSVAGSGFSTQNASLSNIDELLKSSKISESDLKNTFLKLKMEGSEGDVLLELMGVYLILGEQKGFLDILSEAS